MKDVIYILCSKKMFDDLKIKKKKKKNNLNDSIVTVVHFKNFSFYKIFKNEKIFDNNNTKNNFSADVKVFNNTEVIEDYLIKQNIFCNDEELKNLNRQIGDFSFTYYDFLNESIIYGNVGSGNELYIADNDSLYISNDKNLIRIFDNDYIVNKSNYIHRINGINNKTKYIYNEESIETLQYYFENLKKYCKKKQYGSFLKNQYDPMVGRIDELRKLQKSLLNNSITVLTGSGKTTLVNSLSYNIDTKILKVNVNELLSKYDIESLSSFLIESNSILFIDDIKEIHSLDMLSSIIINKNIKAIYGYDGNVKVSKKYKVLNIKPPSIELMYYIIKYNISLNIYDLKFDIDNNNLNEIINLVLKISNYNLKKALDILNKCYYSLIVYRIDVITYNDFISVLKDNNNISNLQMDIFSHYIKSKK